ncbi:MAG: alpha/beta hydrolase family protein [Oligoflexus sp.]
MQQPQLLTTDKRAIHFIVWLGQDAFSFLPNQAALQGISPKISTKTLNLPRRSPIGCRWSLAKEDLSVRGQDLIFISQEPAELVHCRYTADDEQQLTELTAFSISPQSGCPQFHPLSGYLWIEDASPMDERGTKICFRPSGEHNETSVIFSSAGYIRQVRWAEDGESFCCLSWQRQQLAWEADEILVFEKQNKSAFSKKSVYRGLKGIQQILYVEQDQLVVCARHKEQEALYRYDHSQQNWQIIPASMGRFYSRPPWGQWEPCLAYRKSHHSILAISRQAGYCQLEEFFLASGEQQLYPELKEFTDLKHLSLAPSGEQVFMEGASYQHRPQLLGLQLTTKSLSYIKDLEPLNDLALQSPQSFSWSADSYGFYYPARKKHTDKPLLVLIHGGPYQEVCATWPLKAHYFNRLGYSLAYLNFAGSSGQSYSASERIEGYWGVADCEDIIQGVRHLQKTQQASKVILWGGAAGGFAVLHALAAAPELITAGIVVYPYVDLQEVYELAGRLQQDYLHRLILGPGKRNEPLPDDSPSYLNATRVGHISCPVAIFHGQKDQRVPWQSSLCLAKQLEQQGVSVYSRFYPDLGHQWSDRQTLIRYYADVVSFLESLEQQDG